MTIPSSENQDQVTEQKRNDSEYNFAQLRKKLEQEQQARLQAEERAAKLEQLAQNRAASQDDDDDDDGEPYIDRKRLKKEFSKVVPRLKEETKLDVRQEVQKAIQQERQQAWMRSNPDFYEVMNHAQKLADKDPELAETILEMPEGFERNKLVYKNIKALGLHKKEEPKSSIQETIDKNRRSPYYQPTGVGSAPYASAGDFSPSGQKSSYDKMKELQARLRI